MSHKQYYMSLGTSSPPTHAFNPHHGQCRACRPPLYETLHDADPELERLLTEEEAYYNSQHQEDQPTGEEVPPQTSTIFEVLSTRAETDEAGKIKVVVKIPIQLIPAANEEEAKNRFILEHHGDIDLDTDIIQVRQFLAGF
jgi:hypothetical protein